MILKSFEVENNLKSINKFKFILLYGENIGLKEKLKKKISDLNDKSEKVNLYQEDISKNKAVIVNEIKNISLFSDEKIIIINQINDKIFSDIEDLVDCEENVKVVLVGDLLDKKSKLR